MINLLTNRMLLYRKYLVPDFFLFQSDFEDTNLFYFHSQFQYDLIIKK